MIVSASGEVMVTNDGATILQQLMVSAELCFLTFFFLLALFSSLCAVKVEHPAGKVLVDLARLQVLVTNKVACFVLFFFFF